MINEIWWIEEIYLQADKVASLEKKSSDFPKSVQSCFKWKTFEKLLESRENAYLSLKLATIDLDVELTNFDLEKYKFIPENFKNDEAIAYFKEMEFNSLLEEWEFSQKMTTWKDLWLWVKIIKNKEWLQNLENLIKNSKQISFDTETTSLDVMQAKIVWVSIYIDDKNIFYINVEHKGDKVDKIDLKNFLKNIFNLDILIIWHNLKYDLEVIENFMKADFENLVDLASTPVQTTLLI